MAGMVSKNNSSTGVDIYPDCQLKRQKIVTQPMRKYFTRN